MSSDHDLSQGILDAHHELTAAEHAASVDGRVRIPRCPYNDCGNPSIGYGREGKLCKRHYDKDGPLKLDLGGGQQPREGFTSVDIVDLPGSYTFDLISGTKWPWPEGSVDELSSSHFIEHIPADYVEVVKAIREPKVPGVKRVLKDRLFFFFDEAFRVIKPGGLFHLVWPALKSANAFRDPTHRRFLPLEFTYYLSASARQMMRVDHYEVSCNWNVVDSKLGLQPMPEELKPELGPSWKDLHRHLFWNVEDHFIVTLQAEK